MIIAPERSSVELSPQWRRLFAVIGVLGMALLVSSRQLEPDPRGFGTHEQLRIAPCYFRERVGDVCPLCGSTTAWAYATRGDLLAAVNANLAATLLCVAVGIGSLWAMAVATIGRLRFQPTCRWLLVVMTAWLAVAVLDWLRKLTAD